MASSSQHIEQKVLHDSQNAPLPAPLAYTRPNELFAGNIFDLEDGEKIDSSLFQACKTGDLETVKAILEKHNIGVNVGLKYNDTLLIIALDRKQTRLVKFLLNEPSIRISQVDGIRALYSALHINRDVVNDDTDFNGANYEIALALIKAGVNINHVEHFTRMESWRNRVSTLLTRAWIMGNQELSNRLISWGANIERSEQCYIENCIKDGRIERTSYTIEAERQVLGQIALSKQYFNEQLNNSKFSGIECARLSLRQGKDTGFMGLPTFICAHKSLSLADRAFMWGYEMMRKRLAVRLPKPVFVQLSKPTILSPAAPTPAPMRRALPPPPPSHSAAGDIVLTLISEMELGVIGGQDHNNKDLAENATMIIEQAAQDKKQFPAPRDIQDIEAALNALQAKYATPGNLFYSEIAQRVERCKEAFGLKTAVRVHLNKAK